ncbi:MAG: flagellar basal-body rod protein FlgG [bacterium]|nr:flagellar basal-body rod protein FlgG [bacterium]
MLRAMTSAASGMKAQQTNIDTIANNLANVNTAGYKKSHAEFQDLLYEQIVPTGRGSGDASPTRVEIGHGVKLVGTNRVYSQGLITQTENPLDMMIEGDGFFQVSLPDGSVGYTRDGSFKLDADRNLVTAAGYRIEPPIQIPLDATDVSIARDGTVSVLLAGDSSTVQDVAQIELAKFANPAGLTNRGGNILLPSPNSGQPLVSQAGLDGLGEIASGFLEMSNVETVEELVKMITAQRAYELNAKTITMADDMMQTVNQLKR